MTENSASDGEHGSRRNFSLDAWRDQVVRLLEFRMQLLLALCCASWGLTLGIVVWRPQPGHEPPAQENPRGADASESLAGVSQHAADHGGQVTPATVRQLQLIDVMLIHGSVAQAMDAYARLEPETDTELYDQLLYRIAVARETLQQLDRAGEAYQQLALQTKEPQMALAARLGQLRIWLREGRTDLARPVIARSNVELDETTVSERVQGELAHMFGLILLPDVPTADDPFLDDDRVAPAQPRWTPTQLLQLAESPDEPTQKPINPSHHAQGDASNAAVNDSTRVGTELISRFGNHPAEIQLRIAEPSCPVAHLMDAISQAAQLKLNWSSSAKAALGGRSMRLAHPTIAAAVALDQVLLSFDLCWFFESDTVCIRSWAEITDEQKSAFLHESSTRELRHAITVHPEHPLAPYSFLALGNIEFYDRAYTNAVSVYDQFQNQFPSSVDVVFAQFNAAKTLLKLQRRQEALEKFLRVADGAHGHPLQSAANAYAGRIQLEQGATREAIRPLMRSVSTAATPAARVVPALTLASAFLMVGNSPAATQVLMEERHNMVREHDRALADFLGSYARFLASEKDGELLQNGRSLIRSLGHLKIETCFGAHLCLLAGDALRDTGFTPQMAELYQSTLQQSLPMWVHRQAQIRLVSYFVENGNYEQARALLRQIIDTTDRANESDIAFRHDALVRLATLELDEEKPDACLVACREVVNEQPATEILQQVLKLMGRAYQNQGDHYHAALCFAGMLPHADQDPESELKQALESKGH